MTHQEIGLITSAYYDKSKPEWEQTRFLAHAVLTPYSKSRLKLTDVLQFVWDGDNIDADEMTREDMENIKNQYQDMLG